MMIRTLCIGLAVAALGWVSPANAAPADPQQQFFEAFAQMSDAMQSSASEGWQGQCAFSVGDSSTSVAVSVGAKRSAGSLVTVEAGSPTSLWLDYRPSKRIFTVGPGSVRGVTDTNLPAVLKRAGVSPAVEYAWAPYEPWADRYTVDESPPGFSAARSSLVQGMLTASGISILPSYPGLVYTKTLLIGQGEKWTITGGGGGSAVSGELLRGSLGRLTSWTFQVTSGGVPSLSATCSAGNYGITPSIPSVDAAKIAPLEKVGPAAWRVQRSAQAATVANAIREGVLASGDPFTPSRILIQSGVELHKAGLAAVFTLTSLTSGARISTTDPLGGTVKRCIKAQKGQVIVSTC